MLRLIIKIIGCHRSTTTITTMADHSQCQQKLPPSAAHKAFCHAPSSFLKGLRGCIALITLQSYGGASLPEQRSTLRAIHPLNGGSLHINLMHQNEAQCLVWGVRGYFHHRQSWLWRCFAACQSRNHFFRLNYSILGIIRKLLTRQANFSHQIMTNM